MANETWLMPYAVDDPGDDWTTEEATLKDSMTSQAERDDLPPDTWTGYLVWSYTPATHNLLNIGFYVPTSNWYYEVDLYDGEHWRLVHAGPNDIPTLPVEFAFPLTRVEKIRLRLGHSDAGLKEADAFRAKLKLICTGPLAPICGIFHTVGDFFVDLADRIDDIMFVGDALAAPFVSLAGTFHDLGDTCCQVSATLQDILDALEGGLTADEILALLREHWPALAALLDDPVAYITEIVSPLIPDLPDWLDDPVAYITEIVLGILPDLPDWLTDPVAWLAAMFEEHFPLLYYLIVDPGGWLLYMVGEAFDLPPYEAQSWDFILKALFERYFPELYLLWRELQLWSRLYEREGAVGVLTELKDRFYGLAEQAIRFLWEGVWRTS